ncbi:MAG: gamma-glutamyltransferase family protein [Acidimicrobiales bacterium]
MAVPASLPAGGTVHAPNGMVCSVDHLASAAGVALLRSGGSAADAALAASAVLAVTTQHMCGMGGDLFALVHHATGAPAALAAVGRAGSGADAAAMRAEGLRTVPPQGDVRAATVPGCVDGWLALHERFGRAPLAEVLAPAESYARDGFPASPILARSAPQVAGVEGAGDFPTDGSLRTGDRIRRPLVADVLTAIARGGRDAFYGGAFGAGLVELGRGLFADSDLSRPLAAWVEPLSVTAWGAELWTMPPPSQGYITLAAAWMAEELPLPTDPDDAAWAHLLAEAVRQASFDRPEVLHEHADGRALIDPSRLRPRRDAIHPDQRGSVASPGAPGDTIYLCAVDGSGMGVSLIQSNASGWGCHLVVPGTGIFLHDRGIGFSLDVGHPAELAPARRPPHTLAPALVTRGGALHAVLGTMGGDTQPQVVLQLLARLLHGRQSPGAAVRSPRWAIGGGGGFDVWTGDDPPTAIEWNAPDDWEAGLRARGHEVVRAPRAANLGHAHAIVVGPEGMLAGAADPRALTGAAIGW